MIPAGETRFRIGRCTDSLQTYKDVRAVEVRVNGDRREAFISDIDPKNPGDGPEASDDGSVYENPQAGDWDRVLEVLGREVQRDVTGAVRGTSEESIRIARERSDRRFCYIGPGAPRNAGAFTGERLIIHRGSLTSRRSVCSSQLESNLYQLDVEIRTRTELAALIEMGPFGGSSICRLREAPDHILVPKQAGAIISVWKKLTQRQDLSGWWRHWVPYASVQGDFVFQDPRLTPELRDRLTQAFRDHPQIIARLNLEEVQKERETRGFFGWSGFSQGILNLLFFGFMVGPQVAATWRKWTGKVKTIDYESPLRATLLQDSSYTVIGREKESEKAWRMSDNRYFRGIIVSLGTGEGKDEFVKQMIIDKIRGCPWVPKQFLRAKVKRWTSTEAQADTMYRGSYASKIAAIAADARRGPVIYVMSEIDAIFLSGGTTSGDSESPGKLLLDLLEDPVIRRNLMIIGTTSRAQEMLRRYPDLDRRFKWPQLHLYTPKEVTDIIKQGYTRREIQADHQVAVSDEVVDTAVKIAEQVVRPASAKAKGHTTPRFTASVNLLGDAARRAHDDGRQEVTVDDVRAAAETQIGKPLSTQDLEPVIDKPLDALLSLTEQSEISFEADLEIAFRFNAKFKRIFTGTPDEKVHELAHSLATKYEALPIETKALIASMPGDTIADVPISWILRELSTPQPTSDKANVQLVRDLKQRLQSVRGKLHAHPEVFGIIDSMERDILSGDAAKIRTVGAHLTLMESLSGKALRATLRLAGLAYDGSSNQGTAAAPAGTARPADPPAGRRRRSGSGSGNGSGSSGAAPAAGGGGASAPPVASSGGASARAERSPIPFEDRSVEARTETGARPFELEDRTRVGSAESARAGTRLSVPSLEELKRVLAGFFEFRGMPDFVISERAQVVRRALEILRTQPTEWMRGSLFAAGPKIAGGWPLEKIRRIAIPERESTERSGRVDEEERKRRRSERRGRLGIDGLEPGFERGPAGLFVPGRR